jgi:hypothetical protein
MAKKMDWWNEIKTSLNEETKLADDHSEQIK